MYFSSTAKLFQMHFCGIINNIGIDIEAVEIERYTNSQVVIGTRRSNEIDIRRHSSGMVCPNLTLGVYPP